MAHGAAIAAFVLCLLVAISGWTNRALAIAGTGTVPAGHAEIELKSRYARNPTNESSRLAGIVSVGIAPGFQATVESRLLLVEPDGAAARGGFGDTFAELTCRLLNEGHMLPAVAVVPAMRFPTGSPDRGLGATGYEPGVLVALSKRLGEIGITGNAGWSSVTAEDEDASDTWTVAGAAERRLTPRWTLFGESVNTIGTRSADTAVVRAGISWQATPGSPREVRM
ncbi:MAG: transporter [Candidatus Binatia bacterium]